MSRVLQGRRVERTCVLRTTRHEHTSFTQRQTKPPEQSNTPSNIFFLKQVWKRLSVCVDIPGIRKPLGYFDYSTTNAESRRYSSWISTEMRLRRACVRQVQSAERSTSQNPICRMCGYSKGTSETCIKGTG